MFLHASEDDGVRWSCLSHGDSNWITRISKVGPERGTADTTRDVCGWAIKLKTEKGNNDWVFHDLPVFFVRDRIKFPSLNCSHRRNSDNNAADDYSDDPNYAGSAIRPTSFKKTKVEPWQATSEGLNAPVSSASQVTDDNFEQSCLMWNKVLAKQAGARDRFVQSISDHISQARRQGLREEACDLFRRVDQKLGDRIETQVSQMLRARTSDDAKSLA